MLTVDPSKRITIHQIVNHEWIKMANEDPEFEELVSYMRSSESEEAMDLHDGILSHMENLGLDREMTEKVSLINFKFLLVHVCEMLLYIFLYKGAKI
jgi:serine/threonine protein kinase